MIDKAFLWTLILISYVATPDCAHLGMGKTGEAIKAKDRLLKLVFIGLRFSDMLCSPSRLVDSICAKHTKLSVLRSFAAQNFPMGSNAFTWRTIFGPVWDMEESSLRWHAPVCAFGMLGFWLLAAEGE
jgi:hypothetical protein